VKLADVPEVAFNEFRDEIINSNGRLVAFFGQPTEISRVKLTAVLAHDSEGLLEVLTTVVGDMYPSLTPDFPQAHWFEREIAEQFGVRPIGHPWLKPIRFHSSYRTGHDAWDRTDSDEILPGVTNLFEMKGQEVHEVAVGPVHAGIIEPGHFRFQCHGENVYHLEISLGYQHRGVEQSLLGGPDNRTMTMMEALAGDTTIGHGTAYSQIIESLSNTNTSARAQAIRGIALELERLANHTGDLGALSGDVGYLPTASFCGRIRGDFLNMTALICGSRFGRGLVRPGGVKFDLIENREKELLERLARAAKDVTVAVNLLWNTPSVMGRFEDTGIVSKKICDQLGLVGPAARACGVERDVRFDYPTGIYQFSQIPVSSWDTGDVFARAQVRWLEVQRSTAFIKKLVEELPDGPVFTRISDHELQPDRLVVSMAEGWRGEICHVAQTSRDGKFTHYKIVDPSFHNWMGLAMALRDQPISDFPLCNKSFNLSYCGHDL
jgi:Ni,Fe-hydrogenase III large subunit